MNNRIQRPPKLHELVAEGMQDALNEEGWSQGTRLPPERELCLRFGVSRTVIRETVKVLVTRGVLHQIPGKGTFVLQNVAEPLKQLLDVFVRKDTSKRYAHLFEVRNILEVEIAGLAAERASPKDIESLEQINRSLRRIHDRINHTTTGDTTQYNDRDFEFHLAIAKCTGNDFFVVLLTALGNAFKGIWNTTHHSSEVRCHGLEMHERILNAIRTHNPDLARQVTCENLKAFLADAESNLRTVPTPTSRRNKKAKTSSL